MRGQLTPHSGLAVLIWLGRGSEHIPYCDGQWSYLLKRPKNLVTGLQCMRPDVHEF